MTPASDPGQSRHVELGAGRFHYRAWTTTQPSPISVVLLHGVAGSVASWSRVGPALAAAGTSAFALDLRGHGGSIRPPPGSYTLAAAADDVTDFLTALPLAAPVLVGHCWGANIALALATCHDRPSPDLTGLILEEPLATLSPRDNATTLQQLHAAIRNPADHLATLTRRHGTPPTGPASCTACAPPTPTSSPASSTTAPPPAHYYRRSPS